MKSKTLVIVLLFISGSLFSQNNSSGNDLIEKCFIANEESSCDELFLASKYAFDSLNRFDVANEATIEKIKYCLKTNTPEHESILYTYIALNYNVIGEMDSSDVYFKLAEQNINSHNQSQLLFWFELKKFSFYQKKGNYSFAIINLENVINLHSEELTISEKARACNLLGYYYERIGKTKHSVDYFFKAHVLANSLKNKHLYAVIMNNIGNSYAISGDLNTAKKYFSQGIASFETENQPMTVPMLYNNLAKLYEQMGKLDTALAFYKKCLTKSEEIGSNNTSDVETNISNIFLDKNEIDSSLFYLQRAFDSSIKKGKNSREHIHVLQMLSNIEKKKGNIKKATELLSEAFYLSKGVGLLSEMEVFSRELSSNFDISGKKDSALFFLTTHIAIKDTLEKQSSKEKLIARIEKGKLDSMQVRTQLLEAEKEYLNLEISKKNSTVILISCLLICVIVLIIVLIRSYKRKKLIMEYQIQENETTINTKNKELIGAKLEIVAHSDALNQLNKKIKHKLSEKYDPEFDDLSNILRQSVHFSNSSEKKKYLNDLVKLDNDFYKTLKSRFDTLTEDELKLSALIRLNLSSDELLDIFKISKSSLNTKRYRLRKKLLLDKNQSLDEFIKLL